jgi:hypothetical protein
MKFCQPHWNRLKAEITSLGVADFIAQDGKEAMAQMVGDLKGETKTRQNYDPLMGAYWMITNRALESGGLYLMTQDENGNERCPLCEVVKHAPPPPDWTGPAIDEMWIKGASKAAVAQIAALPDDPAPEHS